MSFAFIADHLTSRFALLALTALIAGIARGLSGFGTGLIVAPVAAALYDPQTAVVIVVVMDSLPTIPVSIPAMRIAQWREVLPCLAGLAALLPVGVFILRHVDGETLRWTICIAILLVTAALWSGWRYRGPRNAAVSFSVGGIAGILSGTASIPGPPVIIYWMASALSAAQVRANLMSLFLLGELLSFVNLGLAGVIDAPRAALGVMVAPLYFLGLLTGWLLYGKSSDAVYRRVTFALIVAAALLAMPPSRHVFEMLSRLVA